MADDLDDPQPEIPRPLKLTYGPPPPWYRTAGGRYTAALVGGIALALGAMVFGPPLIEQIELLRMQRDALSAFADRADEPVLGPDPTAAGHVPAAWSTFYAAISSPGLRSDGTALVARRKRPGDGVEFIVAIDLHRQPALGESQAIFAVARIIQPATLLRRPRLIHPGELQLLHASSAPMRVYPGRTDASDPSHFSLRILAGEQEQLIDGWLTSETRVLLESRR